MGVRESNCNEAEDIMVFKGPAHFSRRYVIKIIIRIILIVKMYLLFCLSLHNLERDK